MRGKSINLRLSKIADGVFFGTWVTASSGEDSVVWNLKDMTVFCHLYNGVMKKVVQYDGVIRCYGDSNECIPPETTPQ